VLGVIVFLLDLTIFGSALAWIGLFAFAIPLGIRQISGKRSDVVKQNATESLNFQLTVGAVFLVLYIILVALTATTFILGILVLPLMLGVNIFSIVVMIKGGRAAGRGELYHYPLTVRLIKNDMF